MNKRQRRQREASAAAQASLSERTGRKIKKGNRQSIPGERHWRTWENPFEAIWQ